MLGRLSPCAALPTTVPTNNTTTTTVTSSHPLNDVDDAGDADEELLAAFDHCDFDVDRANDSQMLSDSFDDSIDVLFDGLDDE